jgi:predicted DNA-binding protein
MGKTIQITLSDELYSTISLISGRIGISSSEYIKYLLIQIKEDMIDRTLEEKCDEAE